jgi:hypothetical protein
MVQCSAVIFGRAVAKKVALHLVVILPGDRAVPHHTPQAGALHLGAARARAPRLLAPAPAERLAGLWLLLQSPPRGKRSVRGVARSSVGRGVAQRILRKSDPADGYRARPSEAQVHLLGRGGDRGGVRCLAAGLGGEGHGACACTCATTDTTRLACSGVKELASSGLRRRGWSSGSGGSSGLRVYRGPESQSSKARANPPSSRRQASSSDSHARPIRRIGRDRLRRADVVCERLCPA